MRRMGHWLGSRSMKSASSQSLNRLDEPQYLEDALRAATHIMNDDVDAAEEGLSKGNSAFHKLGKGMVTFLKATLGFEGDVMREASERLADAESTASEQLRQAHRMQRTYHSSIYPIGSEYALCQAEAQLMSAVVAVLNENLTESIKGFYKIRKAYATLDSLIEAERKFVGGRSTTSLGSYSGSFVENQKPVGSIPGGFDDSSNSLNNPYHETNIGEPDTVDPSGQQEDEEDEFFDVDEANLDASVPSKDIGHEEMDNMETNMHGPSTDTRKAETNGNAAQPMVKTSTSTSTVFAQDLQANGALEQGPDSDVFSSPVDTFIHSGANLCFGIMLLMISLIPPAFSKLLFIIGFRGDRDRGIRLLWQASRFNNVNGAMAALVIFGYYNGLIGFCDILPETGDGAYPRERCQALLVEMRARYPKSHLWLLEDARMHASNKELEKALKIMSGSSKSPLKQVEALQWFENSLNCMYLHSYQACADGFLKCVDLNNWSHGLYIYIAGTCHIELYRQYATSDPSRAQTHAAKATELLLKVPANTGKKRLLARQLPFDVFVNRKIAKWQARAKERRCELVDAVGVSPVEEMIYFWNGYKRMRAPQMQESLRRLAWSEAQRGWDDEAPLDERAILAVLRAATWRNLGRVQEARALLKEQVLGREWAEFKGGGRDNWTMPVAAYEMAVCAWQESREGSDAGGADQARNVESLRECAKWLDKVAHWESFDLDARVGIKVSTGKETLRKLGVTVSS